MKQQGQMTVKELRKILRGRKPDSVVVIRIGEERSDQIKVLPTMGDYTQIDSREQK